MPKTALNHTSVFLNKTGKFENLMESYDEVPDENVDETSLSRVSDKIVSRGSITNRLNNKVDSPYKNTPTRSSFGMKTFSKSNFLSINLDSPANSPYCKNKKNRGIILSNYAPPMKMSQERRKFSGNFQQRSFQNRELDNTIKEVMNERITRMAIKLQDERNKNIINVFVILNLIIAIKTSSCTV